MTTKCLVMLFRSSSINCCNREWILPLNSELPGKLYRENTISQYYSEPYLEIEVYLQKNLQVRVRTTTVGICIQGVQKKKR